MASAVLALAVAGARGADRESSSPIILEEFDVPGDGDRLWVPVTTGGAARLFIIDTGCTKVVYDESLQSMLGQPHSVQVWRSSAGSFRFPVFEARAARLGCLDLFATAGPEKPLVGCMDLSRYAAVSGVDLSGLVGMSFLKHHVVRLDFDRGKLSFLSSPDPDAGVPFPLEFERDVPRVSVELPAVGKKVFKIDTGCVGDNGSLDAELARSLEKRGLATVVGAQLSVHASAITQTRTLRVAALKIGDFEHSNLIFSEHTGGVPSLLGMGYLSRFIVTFDFPKRTLYLKPGRYYSRRDRGLVSEGCSQFGLRLRHEDGKTRVEYVIPDGQAARTGVEPLDTILAVNGTNVAGSRLFAVHRLITDARGDVRLKIERDGTRHDFVLRAPRPLVVASPDAPQEER